MEKIFLLLTVVFVYANAVPLEESASDRIVNGINATDTQFPYVVSIQPNPNIVGVVETRGHHCGGVLVTLQHVLSAGLCAFTYYLPTNILTPIVATNYRVFAGASHLANDTSANRVRAIANYTVHPEFIPPPSHVNDIAIFTLIAPFLATVVTPLPLPSSSFHPAVFTECTTAGWGSINSGSFVPSVELKFTRKYIFNQMLCNARFLFQPHQPNILPSMVCAAQQDITATSCWGDMGNPLVCRGTLTGILFMTDCQATSLLDLYTRVSNYTTWIRSVTGSASTFNPSVFTLALFIFLHAFQKIL